MFREESVIGVIPARGGSRRLPGKNNRSLANKPLIGWTICAAHGSTTIDKVVVSTEDAEIRKVATEQGAADVIKRSAMLATDDAFLNDVIVEVLNILKEQGEIFGYIVLLQPTSPLRTAAHIDDAFKLITKENGIGAVSVCRTEHPLEWMGRLSPDGSLDSFFSPNRT